MNLQTLKVLLSENWLGSTIGLVCLVFAVYTYVKSKRVSRLSWRFSGVRLVGEHAQLASKLAVSYDGAVVPRLTLSKVFLWNSGTETVRRADIVERDRLRIELGAAARVLSATVEKSVRAVNAISVESGEASTYVDFDFLDPGDGARISLLHNGEKMKPLIVGTIKGMPKGFSGGEPFPDIPDTRFPRGRALSAALVFTALFGAVLLVGATMHEMAPKTALAARWVTGILGSMFLFSGIVAPLMLRLPFPSALAENAASESRGQNAPPPSGSNDG